MGILSILRLPGLKTLIILVENLLILLTVQSHLSPVSTLQTHIQEYRAQVCSSVAITLQVTQITLLLLAITLLPNIQFMNWVILVLLQLVFLFLYYFWGLNWFGSDNISTCSWTCKLSVLSIGNLCSICVFLWWSDLFKFLESAYWS